MQRYHDVISSFGGKTSYDADNRPLLVMRSNLWASGYDVDGTDQTSLGQFHQHHSQYMAVGFYVAKYVNKKSDMDLAAKGLGAKEWNNSLKTKLSLLPKKLFRSEERFSRNAETDLVCRLLLEKKNDGKTRGSEPMNELMHQGNLRGRKEWF